MPAGEQIHNYTSLLILESLYITTLSWNGPEQPYQSQTGAPRSSNSAKTTSSEDKSNLFKCMQFISILHVNPTPVAYVIQMYYNTTASSSMFGKGQEACRKMLWGMKHLHCSQLGKLPDHYLVVNTSELFFSQPTSALPL